MIDVEITKEPVELYKILKFEGLVQSGGEAKMAIANGHVVVNGEVETRKRRKIVDGDRIEFSNVTLKIHFASPTA
jgi:ribosome-associated protein